jgi:hypothetical protein
MTAKAKAEELIKWATIYGASEEVSKLFAIKLVDEVMKQCWEYRDIDLQKSFDYWNEVKHEIEKL